MRWLLPIVAVLGFLGTSLTTFAAAGVVGATECCCPDPDRCKCHDHDGEPRPSPELKRCGGKVDLVTPHLTAAILPEAPGSEVTLQVITIEHTEDPRPPPRYERPETPPF